jgi:hypothetical protein
VSTRRTRCTGPTAANHRQNARVTTPTIRLGNILGIKSNCKHEDRQTELAATEADQPAECADWHTPAERSLKETRNRHRKARAQPPATAIWRPGAV